MAFPMLAFAAISLGSKLYSGYSKNKSLREEGAAVAQQGEEIYAESLREADMIRREGDIFSQKQSMQYIGAGVVLGGSSLITLKQTKMFAEEKASSVVRRGEATRDLGYAKEKIAKREGTASIIGGFGDAAVSMLSRGASK